MTTFGCLFSPRCAAPLEEPAAKVIRRCRIGGTHIVKAIGGADTFVVLVTEGIRGLTTYGYATDRHLLAVGDVRLDNRRELARLTASPEGTAPDLALILATYARHGRESLSLILGDYCFVIWDSRAREAVAVRDPMGVKRLFFAEHDGVVLVSNNLDVVSSGSAINEDYVASYLTGVHRTEKGSTIWRDSWAVNPGTCSIWTGTDRREHRYWPPKHFAPICSTEAEAIEEFRSLLLDSVRVRLADVDVAWSELSGGLDSSTIVGVTDFLRRAGAITCGLVGTYTFTDASVGADQRRFIREVVDRAHVRNEQILNSFPWQDDGLPPPITEEPRVSYPFWARDRRAQDVVRRSGANVLLSGGGSDYYLTGSPLLLADLIKRGRLVTALRQAQSFAARLRGSMWRLVWDSGFLPLMPPNARALCSPRKVQLPAWINREFRRRFDLVKRKKAMDDWSITSRSLLVDQSLRNLSMAAEGFELPLTRDTVEIRYPFFHRPMIEFALGLAPDVLWRGGTTKWILRQAARDFLPEVVRTRTTKESIDGRICWALSHQYDLLSKVVRDPALAQAGWVALPELKAELERARAGSVMGLMPLMRALSLETWLAVRNRTWLEAPRPTGSPRVITV